MFGRPASMTEADCAIYTKQMKELKRLQAYDYTCVIWQLSLNLMGKSENPTLLQGKAIENEEEFLKARLDNAPMAAIFRTQKLRLYAVFGEHEKGADLFSQHGFDWPAAAPGHPMFMEAVFCGGLSSFASARSDRKSKKSRKARKKLGLKALKTIKGWLKQGNPSVVHQDSLLDAEKAVLEGKVDVAEKHYRSAASIAARSGFSNDAAIACERFGEFLLEFSRDEEAAANQFQNSIRFYTEYGATKKVDLLAGKYSHLWVALPGSIAFGDHTQKSVSAVMSLRGIEEE